MGDCLTAAADWLATFVQARKTRVIADPTCIVPLKWIEYGSGYIFRDPHITHNLPVGDYKFTGLSDHILPELSISVTGLGIWVVPDR